MTKLNKSPRGWRVKAMVAAFSIGVSSFFPVLLSSCAMESLGAPFVIGKPRCDVGEKSGCYLVAGIEFDLYNTDSRDIRSFSVSAMVYDRETGQNPFIGNNRVTATFTGILSGNSKGSFSVSLDPFLHSVPSEPFIVDFFYVSGIDYADGTRWTDENGLYHTGSE